MGDRILVTGGAGFVGAFLRPEQPSPSNVLRQPRPDLSLAKRTLNWAPKAEAAV